MAKFSLLVAVLITLMAATTTQAMAFGVVRRSMDIRGGVMILDSFFKSKTTGSEDIKKGLAKKVVEVKKQAGDVKKEVEKQAGDVEKKVADKAETLKKDAEKKKKDLEAQAQAKKKEVSKKANDLKADATKEVTVIKKNWKDTLKGGIDKIFG